MKYCAFFYGSDPKRLRPEFRRLCRSSDFLTATRVIQNFVEETVRRATVQRFPGREPRAHACVNRRTKVPFYFMDNKSANSLLEKGKHGPYRAEVVRQDRRQDTEAFVVAV